MKILISIILFILPVFVFAQTDKDNSMSAWQKYVTPGNTHKFLSVYEGEWTEEISIWMSAGSQPEKFTITTVNKMILGGRYLQTTQSGYMAGTTFEGINTLGQHANSEKFTLTIIDNMGTGTLTLQGFWATPEKVIELFGDIPSPENNDVVHVRQVITFVDKDHYIIQNFDKRASHNEYKSAEYHFTRTTAQN